MPAARSTTQSAASSSRRSPPSAAGAPDGGRVVRAFLAVPKVADWLDRYPPGSETDALVRPAAIEPGRCTSGRARRARSRPGGRGRRRARARGLDRPAGRLEDGAWPTGRVRGQAPHVVARLARPLGDLPARPRRPAPAALAAGRSTCSSSSPSASRSPSSTAGTCSRARRSRCRRSSTCWRGPRGSASARRPAQGRAATWPVWALAVATAVPRRLPHRASTSTRSGR